MIKIFRFYFYWNNFVEFLYTCIQKVFAWVYFTFLPWIHYLTSLVDSSLKVQKIRRYALLHDKVKVYFKKQGFDTNSYYQSHLNMYVASSFESDWRRLYSCDQSFGLNFQVYSGFKRICNRIIFHFDYHFECWLWWYFACHLSTTIACYLYRIFRTRLVWLHSRRIN